MACPFSSFFKQRKHVHFCISGNAYKYDISLAALSLRFMVMLKDTVGGTLVLVKSVRKNKENGSPLNRV